MADKKWGLLSASLTLPDGTGTPEPVSHSIRPRFGTKATPRGGVAMAVFSTGHAAAKGDTNPPFYDWVIGYSGANDARPYPADWLAANGGNVPKELLH